MGGLYVTGLAQSVRITDRWIAELDQGLGWNDKPRSYRLLSSVLRAMREAHAARCDTDFPVRLCGTRCDDLPLPGTVVARAPAKQFIERVAMGFKPDPIADPKAAIAAVIELLSGKIDGEGLAAIHRSLPDDLQQEME